MERRVEYAIWVAAISACIALQATQGQQRAPAQMTAVSGDLVTEITRTSPNGIIQTARKVQKYTRDVDNSTRVEDDDKVIITNMTLHKVYILLLRDRMAQEMDLPRAPDATSAQKTQYRTTQAAPQESLGTADVGGYKAEGKSVLFDTGTQRGAKLETWRSEQLSLQVWTVVSNAGGTTTTSLENIKRETALNRDLFSVPTGFVIRQIP